MKLALTWFAIIVLGSCSITHKSGEYACVTQSECTTDRVCSEGFCVVPTGTVDAPGTHHIDAPKQTVDAPQNICPVGCSSCQPDTKQCTIACGSPGAANCGQPINCPPGWSCDINCKNTNDCRTSINCSSSHGCHVSCSGDSSCRNITCGSGPCNVECSGTDSCSRGVSCGSSCQCDVSCSGAGTQTCGSAIFCGQTSCNDGGGGCTSTPLGLCSSPCL